MPKRKAKKRTKPKEEKDKTCQPSKPSKLVEAPLPPIQPPPKKLGKVSNPKEEKDKTCQSSKPSKLVEAPLPPIQPPPKKLGKVSNPIILASDDVSVRQKMAKDFLTRFPPNLDLDILTVPWFNEDTQVEGIVYENGTLSIVDHRTDSLMDHVEIQPGQSIYVSDHKGKTTSQVFFWKQLAMAIFLQPTKEMPWNSVKEWMNPKVDATMARQWSWKDGHVVNKSGEQTNLLLAISAVIDDDEKALLKILKSDPPLKEFSLIFLVREAHDRKRQKCLDVLTPFLSILKKPK